jgi:hypothetical protein
MTRAKLENVIVAYANYNPEFTFAIGYLHMIAPLYYVLKSETVRPPPQRARLASLMSARATPWKQMDACRA